jgi:hypothetical protein
MQPLRNRFAITAQSLRNCCATTAQPLRNHFAIAKTAHVTFTETSKDAISDRIDKRVCASLRRRIECSEGQWKYHIKE